MNGKGAVLAAVVSAACLAVLPACSDDSANEDVLTGRVTSTIPAFCVGASGDTGMCFVTTEATGTSEKDLAAGDCVRVTYAATDGAASTAKATKVTKSDHC
jgi:hypothetical protein